MMDGIAIERASLKDLSGIVALLADDELGQSREIMSEPLAPAYLSAFDAITADPNQFLGVALRGKDVVGCFQLSFIPGLSRLGLWRGQIESVRVASDLRGSGFGTVMFKWAIERCRERGCGLVQLTTDKSRPAALEFYKRLGFVASHEGMKLSLL